MHFPVKNNLLFYDLLTDWLVWKGMDPNFEDMSKQTLADTLRQFYPSARQSPKDSETEGKPYAKQLLINIRSGINRYLQLPPFNKTWDLMQDRDFLAANRVFKGTIKTTCIY